MIRQAAWAASIWAASALGAAAQGIECRLALLLAIDVSSSVDAREDALQRGGLAAALVSPNVVNAVFAGDLPVAIAAFEWSGRYNQEVLIDWTLLRAPADLALVAETLSASKRSHNAFPTAMGYALGFGAGMLQRAPRCLSKTLDMAGDGENNDGFPPAAAYAEFPFADVTVNGLAVVSSDYRADIALSDYYTGEVLYGPGAFLEVADGFDDYERAIRRKLERELSPRAIGFAPPAVSYSAPG